MPCLPAALRAGAPAATLLIALGACAPAAPPPTPVAVRPLIAETPARFAASVVRLTPDSAMQSARAAREAASVRTAPGFVASIWAPEGMVSDPIGIGFDDQGRLYVTQTARTGRNEIDIRAHPDWMGPSITFTTVEDKRAFYQRILAPERSADNAWLQDFNGDGSRDWRDLTFHRERLYRIEDTNADGVADVSQLVLHDFNDLVTDVAHGVMAWGNDVYLTLSPDLWRLRDTTGDGVFDTKESITHGSGVHIGFGGHGHSSPRVGPDGRLYWKQGDLGVNITTRDGRRLYNPHSGVIIRANLDGTEAELFATGLRNPQEFQFDDYGNLIAPDNDGDHEGEEERLMYVVEGLDAGWRINWQFGKYNDPDNNSYKVWMEEGLFRPRFAEQAAYITPPIAPWHAGPSGFDCNPGTALNDRWKGWCFGATFPGEPAGASIRAIRLAPQGAGFRLAADTVVVQGVLTTGLSFGPDGAMYLADWIEGWEPKERGRIWKIDVVDGASSLARAETRRLIAVSFEPKPNSELSDLLRHADQRIRTKAQFELARRGAMRPLLQAARQGDHQLARIHGLWGIGQLARRDVREAGALVDFLGDADPEIRAQAAKLLGDVRYGRVASRLVGLLGSDAPRVQFYAAEALGRIRHRPAIAPLVAMLARNEDKDVYLRHAGALALSRIGLAEPLMALSTHPSRAVRLAAVVALRRMQDIGVARFVTDADALVATEAARAINDDGGIPGAVGALAAALGGPVTNEAFVRRAISANLRGGTEADARRLGTYATTSSATDELRAEAVAALGVWPRPSILDRVDGHHLGPVQRDTTAARTVLAGIANQLLSTGGVETQVAMVDAVGRLRMTDAATLVFERVRGAPQPAVRAASLRALARLGDARVETALRAAVQDPDAGVRAAALQTISAAELPEATKTELLAAVALGRGTVGEQQNALASLGRLRGATGREMLTRLVERLTLGEVAPEIQLDVIEAARATAYPPLVARLDSLDRARATAAPLVAYADLLRGGDARNGYGVAHWKPSAQCVRCHAMGDGPGANVGPPLRRIGAQLTREQILEALVAPSARIAPGYGFVQVTLRSGGERVAGTLREEGSDFLVIESGGSPRRVAKSEISARTNGPSAMPPMGGILSRREIRDVVEYLSTLR